LERINAVGVGLAPLAVDSLRQVRIRPRAMITSVRPADHRNGWLLIDSKPSGQRDDTEVAALIATAARFVAMARATDNSAGISL
jgi:hypothetical protein